MTPNRTDKLVPVAAGYSHAGLRREVNEDHLAAPEGVEPELLARRGHLYVVADGMGGHAAGAQASALAVSTVMEAYYGHPSPDPAQALTEAIGQANATLHRQAQRPETVGMGSTVVAALMWGRDLYVAHVGDSRAYLIRGQTIRQLTRDHTWVAEQVEAGLLSEEEARRHPQRNVVTRSLGSGPEVEVDLSREKLRPGDAVLLCSDGLTDEVGDEEIRRTVVGNDPQEAANQLVELAQQRGGSDDVTALVIGIRRARRPAPVDRLKSSRFTPIVGGVAIAAVVLIALYLALPLIESLMPVAIPLPSPTATATVSTPTPSPFIATATPTITASPSVTTPAVAVPVEPTTTPTSIPTAIPTETPGPTSTPTPSCEDLIRNGGFETTGDWTNWIRGETPRPPDYSRDVVWSGAWAMRLGITSESDTKSYSSVKQVVTIPEGVASATLSFRYYPICQDVYPRDWQGVIIYDQSEGELGRAMLPVCSDSQVWTQQTFDLTPYRGRTIIVYFNVYNNGRDGLKTAMYLDDVSMKVCR